MSIIIIISTAPYEKNARVLRRLKSAVRRLLVERLCFFHFSWCAQNI